MKKKLLSISTLVIAMHAANAREQISKPNNNLEMNTELYKSSSQENKAILSNWIVESSYSSTTKEAELTNIEIVTKFENLIDKIIDQMNITSDAIKKVPITLMLSDDTEEIKNCFSNSLERKIIPPIFGYKEASHEINKLKKLFSEINYLYSGINFETNYEIKNNPKLYSFLSNLKKWIIPQLYDYPSDLDKKINIISCIAENHLKNIIYKTGIFDAYQPDTNL